MKRTITLRIEVPDADEYAAFVADVVNHPAVVYAAWTRGEEIKDLLGQDHGMTVEWGEGTGAEWVKRNS